MEKTITSEERARRLAELVRSIAGDTPPEEFVDFSDDNEGLDGMSTQRMKKATDAAVRTFRGQKPSEEGLYNLEAIIHKKDRPSHLVQGNKFDPFAGEFKYLTDHQKTRERLQSTLPLIGRIDITDQNTYGGTGFVVGKNLIMTNRHVAQLFTTGVGRRVKLHPWGSEVDFADAPNSAAADGYELIDCIMIHPYWDMALFKADLPTNEHLTLSTETYESMLKREPKSRDIVAIGYPARDKRNGQRAQQEIFGDEYEVKRIAPGRISQRKRDIGSKWLSGSVAALAHDASTLGGNSGSAVIHVLNGNVAALHFAGRYLVENYGVPAYELARDTRVVDAGVMFASTVDNKNKELDRYWKYTESDEVHDDHSSSDDHNQSYDRNIQMKTNNDNVTIEVPLRITISLGRPGTIYADRSGRGPDIDDGGAAGAVGGGDDGDGSDDFEVGESTGSGYESGFLSEAVPVPGLPKKLADDTFKVNGTQLINYTHFSVCQSMSRRLPRFVAWNIDGGNMKSLSRKGIKFILDSRVPKKYQAGNELYADNKYDRGHVARRADLNWGPLPEAERANRDSFFFTNMTPQHEAFNQSGKGGLWGELENAIFEDVKVDKLKISVIAGPIFRNSDKKYRDVKIPADFWKLIAFHDEDADEFKVAAYIISQKDLVFGDEGKVDDEFHLYQVSLSKLAEETDLDFDEIAEFDSMDLNRESLEGSGMREVTGRIDIII